jgi:hypothetical protein
MWARTFPTRHERRCRRQAKAGLWGDEARTTAAAQSPYATTLSEKPAAPVRIATRGATSLTNPRAGLPPQVRVAETVDDALG